MRSKEIEAVIAAAVRGRQQNAWRYLSPKRDMLRAPKTR